MWSELYGLAVRLHELSEEWKRDVLASWLTLFQPVWLTCLGTSREPLAAVVGGLLKVLINLRHATMRKWRVALCCMLEATQAMPDVVLRNHKHMYIPREICVRASLNLDFRLIRSQESIWRQNVRDYWNLFTANHIKVGTLKHVWRCICSIGYWIYSHVIEFTLQFQTTIGLLCAWM